MPPFSIFPRFFPVCCCFLSWLLVIFFCGLSTADAALTSLKMEHVPGGVRITASGEPGSYFILQSSAQLEAFDPVSIDLGNGGAVWEFDTEGLAGNFWFVRQISLSAPEDTDGDGMDDVWELARELNPLNAADAGLIPERETLTNLEIYLNVWQRKIPDEQAYSRETTVFNHGSALDTPGREVSVFNFGSPPGGSFEALGREITIYNGEQPPGTALGDTISREISLYNFGTPPGGVMAAVSREVSVFNGERPPPTEVNPAISREWSIFNHGSTKGSYEAISREVTVLNFLDPGPP